jgi:(1->4)-alpha-D-glucan 1-alpha-D-glucosylmutase
MPDRRIPASTYRLQLHAGFGFADAAAVVPYLNRLGVSHLYLSPVLQAAPGSMHGYDVVDHSRVSNDLGGEASLEALADEAHRHDLGIVVDVVPNHMALPAPEHLNRQLWDVLREGRSSAFAHWFDVDWDAGDGKILLPVLGDTLEETITSGTLSLGEHAGGATVVYGDHCFPVAPGSDSGDLKALLAAQHYELAYWRDERAPNYRRFFDVDTLVAIRVELEDVFDATHALLLDLHARGIIDAFRIDHPDGLADPQGYLERLHSKVGDRWVVVEKILMPGEMLPPTWPCAGTTGYDAIRAIQGAIAPPLGDELSERWTAVGGEPSYRQTEIASKRQVIRDLFAPELRRLTALATQAAADDGSPLDPANAAEAFAELLAHVAVYRAYLRPGVDAEPESLRRMHEMCMAARLERPERDSEITLLERLLSDTATTGEAGKDLVVRFQQVCGPVMAKGVEDTTYYRWNRFVALNEVGGDPSALDSPHRDHLHGWARKQAAAYPFGMTALSTHDTKRNEDARARLLAVAEDLDGWDAVSEAVLREATASGVDRPTGYLVAQTLIAAWPLSEQRLIDYLHKAIREAKQHTSWNDPDEDYQARVADLARRCLEESVTHVLDRVLSANATTIRAITLGTKLLQLTMPGVPDIYQGTELAEPSLVDPDNRRPVDFERRESMLSELAEAAPPSCTADDIDTQKLWLVTRVLRLRRERPELFDATAGYEAIDSASPHVLGFVRAGALATLVTRWPGRLSQTGWGSAEITLPPGQWSDALTGATLAPDSGAVRAADVLRGLPVALLVRAPR